MITADHGCDPDPRWPTTDHSREYVPILAYTPAKQKGAPLGARTTLADMGQTVAENFGATIPHGKSFSNRFEKLGRCQTTTSQTNRITSPKPSHRPARNIHSACAPPASLVPAAE